jgi:ABC-2 type transport system ATP-binding protein
MSSPPPDVIQVSQLCKRYGDHLAVDRLDLRIAAGECVALLGPNGAGKTTTLEILQGMKPATGGTVRVLGHAWEDAADRIRPRIGVQLQETHFYERMTVEETVALFRSFYPSGLAVPEAIAAVRLEEKRKQQVRALSGGQKQRLSLAVALVGDPELIFLDEPTTGLDPQSRHALWEVIRDLHTRGKTVLLTTHYMEEAERLCDRIVFVDKGQVIAEGSPRELIDRLTEATVVQFDAHPPVAMERLAALPGVAGAREAQGGTRLAVQEPHRTIPALLDLVRAEGAELRSLETRKATLDDVFLNLTGHHLREEDRG